MRARLDHIGIAIPANDTQNIERLSLLYKILGLDSSTASTPEEVPEQGVRTYFFTAAEGSPHIELLEPMNDEGAVAKYLAKRGPGIHHISFRLPKGALEETCRKLTENAFKLLYDAPKIGAHNMRINFIHPQSAGGVLVELMEEG